MSCFNVGVTIRTSFPFTIVCCRSLYVIRTIPVIMTIVIVVGFLVLDIDTIFIGITSTINFVIFVVVVDGG